MARAFVQVCLTAFLGVVAAQGQVTDDQVSGRGVMPAAGPDTNVVERIRSAVADSVSRELEASVPPESADLYRELAQRNQALLQRRRELEYEDPIASGLKKKLIAAEKEVVALRKSLQIRLDAIEEIQAIEAERIDVMQQLQKLRSQSRAAQEGVTGE